MCWLLRSANGCYHAFGHEGHCGLYHLCREPSKLGGRATASAAVGQEAAAASPIVAEDVYV